MSTEVDAERRATRQRRDHRQFVLELLPKRSVGAEVGVWKGDFSARLLAVVQPRELHLIDPWSFQDDDPRYAASWYGGKLATSQADMDRIHDEVLERFAAERRRGVVHVHRLASAEASERFEGGFFDWVYVDGNHLYDFARQDLERFSQKVKTGGYLVADDYQEGGWWEGGVKRAVDEFVAAGRCELVMVRNRQAVLRVVR